MVGCDPQGARVEIKAIVSFKSVNNERLWLAMAIESDLVKAWVES